MSIRTVVRRCVGSTGILRSPIPLAISQHFLHASAGRRHMSGGDDLADPSKPLQASLPPDLSAGTNITAAEVDEYLTQKLTPKNDWAKDPALAKAQRRAKEAGLPDIAVSPMQGQFLAVLAKSIAAKRILEIGTLWGYSTCFLTRALPYDGQIDTLELSQTHASVAAKTFLDVDLYPFPTIHVGPALETLQKLQPPDQEGYDLIFIDADKERSLEYFKEALRLSRKGGTIVVDNAVRRVRESWEGKDSGADGAGLVKLYDFIEKDNGESVLCSGLQTVGVKAWDGFLIAVKR